MQQSSDAVIFRLEGRFTSDGAEHVRTLVAQCKNDGAGLVFDLTELLYVDSVGEEVLLFLRRIGAQFMAETSYALDVCERLDLPLAHNTASHKRGPGGSNGNGAI
jgi:hypothetical protein